MCACVLLSICELVGNYFQLPIAFSMHNYMDNQNVKLIAASHIGITCEHFNVATLLFLVQTEPANQSAQIARASCTVHSSKNLQRIGHRVSETSKIITTLHLANVYRKLPSVCIMFSFCKLVRTHTYSLTCDRWCLVLLYITTAPHSRCCRRRRRRLPRSFSSRVHNIPELCAAVVRRVNHVTSIVLYMKSTHAIAT